MKRKATNGSHGGRSRRLGLAAALIVPALATGAVMMFGAQSASPARAPDALLEVSNSCLPGADTTTPLSLTFWGSGVLPNAQLTVIDQWKYLGPNGFPVTSDNNGTFEATATFTNADLQGQDIFAISGYISSRQVRFATVGTPPCPSTKPGTKPCAPVGAAIGLTADGIISPFGASLEGKSAKWFLDYPGNGNSPSPFATSAVTTGNISATLPAGAASGNHLITAHVEYTTGLFLRDDAWVSWRIAVCAPPKTTTTTPTATTTTTLPPHTGTPHLTVNPAAGPTGSVVSVHGTGFAPGATVALNWTPGLGSVTTVADGSGSFTVPLLVFTHDVIGPRRVVAFAYPPSVSAEFLAGLGSAGPPNPDPSSMMFRQ